MNKNTNIHLRNSDRITHDNVDIGILRANARKNNWGDKEYCLQLSSLCNNCIQTLHTMSAADRTVEQLIYKNINFVQNTNKPINKKTIVFFELALVAFQRSISIIQNKSTSYTFKGKINATSNSYLKKYRIMTTSYPGVFLKRVQYPHNARVTINEIDDNHIQLILASLRRRGFAINIEQLGGEIPIDFITERRKVTPRK